jgi:hypothetical protein
VYSDKSCEKLGTFHKLNVKQQNGVCMNVYLAFGLIAISNE